MQIDAPSPAAEAPSSSSLAERNILLEEKQLKLWDKTEKDIYKQLKTQRFIYTSVYDQALLQAIGMEAECEIIFKTIGWENVWHIDELGSKLLPAEFLCTLQNH